MKRNHVWVVEWWDGKKWQFSTYGFTRAEAVDWKRDFARECPDVKYRVTKYESTREGE